MIAPLKSEVITNDGVTVITWWGSHVEQRIEGIIVVSFKVNPASHYIARHLDSIHKISLRQRQLLTRLGRAMHPVSLYTVRLRVDLHLGSYVVVLHVPLANVSTVLDGLNALPQPVRLDDAGVDGCLGHERHGR